MSIEYRGEKFAGYNKPKRTPKHPTKSHAVLAKEGDTIKLIRFGEQGAKTACRCQPKTKFSTPTALNRAEQRAEHAARTPRRGARACEARASEGARARPPRRSSCPVGSAPRIRRRSDSRCATLSPLPWTPS